MELRDRSATNAKVWPFELMASVLKPCGTVVIVVLYVVMGRSMMLRS